MDDDFEVAAGPGQTLDDLLEDPGSLPDVAPPFSSHKYTRLFSVDVDGPGNDQYVYIVPNGLCVVGLAPSHVLLQHLRADNKPSQATPAADASEPQQPHAHTAPAPNADQQPSQPGEPVFAATVAAPATHQQPEAVAAQEQGHEQPKVGDKRQAASEPPPCSQADASGQPQQQEAQPAKRPATAASQLRVNFDIGKRDVSIKQSGKKRHQGTVLESNTVLCHIEAPGHSRVTARVVAGGKLLEVNQRLSKQPELLLTRPCREGYLAILFPSDNQTAALRRSLMSCEDYLKLRGLSEADLA